MREDILQALSELIKEKTELKTEKIELGLMDEIKGMYADTDKAVSKAEGSYSDILNGAKKSSDLWYKVVERANKTLKAVDLAEKQLKELGVKMPSELKGKKKFIENWILEAYDNIKGLKQINKFIK